MAQILETFTELGETRRSVEGIYDVSCRILAGNKDHVRIDKTWIVNDKVVHLISWIGRTDDFLLACVRAFEKESNRNADECQLELPQRTKAVARKQARYVQEDLRLLVPFELLFRVVAKLPDVLRERV